MSHHDGPFVSGRYAKGGTPDTGPFYWPAGRLRPGYRTRRTPPNTAGVAVAVATPELSEYAIEVLRR